MKTLLLWILLFVGGLVQQTLGQGVFFVRANASGAANGSDWNNAFPSLPSTLQRGATYYVAGGNYPGYSFDDPVSGTLRTTIKKATAGDPGTTTGWQASYAGQAVFGPVTFATDNWEFNGQIRNEGNWREVPSYGFRIPNGGITIGVNVDNVSCRYVDVGGDMGKAIHLNTQGNSPWRSNLVFGHMHMHDVKFAIHSRETSSVTLEYSYLGPTFSKECISHQYGHNWIIRFCKFVDNGQGTGADTQTATIGVFNFSGGGDPADTRADGWQIYGCIFACSSAATQAAMTAQDGLISCGTVNNWKFYNNTICRTGGSWGGAIKLSGSGNEVRNCLWYWMGDYDATYGSIVSATNPGYSWYYYKNPKPARLGYDGSNLTGVSYKGTEDPFIGEAVGDYRLKASFAGVSPVNKGVALGAPYNTDLNGNVRGQDGAWDIGATEFVAGGSSTAPTIASQPASTSAIVGESATFSVTAAGTQPLSYQWQRNGQNISGAGSASYTTPPTVAADNGATFRVVVTNVAGSATSNSATLTVTSSPGNAAPSVTLVQPANGANFDAPANVSISANASDSDGSIARVEFFNGTSKLGEATTAPYQWNWTNVPAGSYTLSARAIDNLGTATSSPPINISVATPSGDTLAVGDRVMVTADPSLRVRSAPNLSASILGAALFRELGTVLAGPVNADGHTFYQINYDTAPDGWSIRGDPAAPWLIRATTAQPKPPTGLRVVPAQ